MKISGRVKMVGIKGQRWAAMVSGKWVSQFINDSMSPELKAALDSVKAGETWEFEVAESKSKTGATFHNVVGAAKTADTGQDAEPAGPLQPDGHAGHKERPETATRIARSVGAQVAGPFLSAMLTAEIIKDADMETLVSMAKRLEHYIETGE